MEQQTNNFLTTEEFKDRIEPSLLALLNMNQFESAQDHVVNVLQTYSMEPELRIELLFTIAASQVMQAQHQQDKLMIRGQKIAKDVGVTQVEAQAVLGMVKNWIASKKQGADNGQAE